MPRKPSAATLAKRAAESENAVVADATPTLADEIRAELAAAEPVNKPVVEPEVVPAPAPRQPLDNMAIVDKIRKEKLVHFTVPEDPRGEIKVWERHFNGHPIVLIAGREYDLPEFIVNTIRQSARIMIESQQTASAFTDTRQGKYLGEIKG